MIADQLMSGNSNVRLWPRLRVGHACAMIFDTFSAVIMIQAGTHNHAKQFPASVTFDAAGRFLCNECGNTHAVSVFVALD